MVTPAPASALAPAPSALGPGFLSIKMSKKFRLSIKQKVRAEKKGRRSVKRVAREYLRDEDGDADEDVFGGLWGLGFGDVFGHGMPGPRTEEDGEDENVLIKVKTSPRSLALCTKFN